MSITLTFENADERFLNITKEIAQVANAKITPAKASKTRLQKTIDEVNRGEVVRYESYGSLRESAAFMSCRSCRISSP